MRKSFVAAVAIAAAITVATPAAAAPRDRDRSQPPAVVIMKIIKKVFGIRTHAEPIIPIPGPSGN